MAGFRGESIEFDEQAHDRQTASLAALAAVLLIVVAGLFLVRVLHREGMLEDCLMAGRPNCDALLVARAR